MGVTGAVNMRGAGKADTAVLITLVIILRVIYLLLISGLEVDPGRFIISYY